MGAELAFVIRQLRRELHVKTNNTSAAIRSSLHHMGAQSAAVYHRGGTAITSHSPVRMLARDCSQGPERLAAHSIGANPLRKFFAARLNAAVHATERNAHRLPRINGPDHSRAYTCPIRLVDQPPRSPAFIVGKSPRRHLSNNGEGAPQADKRGSTRNAHSPNWRSGMGIGRTTNLC